MRESIVRQRKATRERRMKECVDWDPNMKFAKELNIKGDSYQMRNLFPEVEQGPVDKLGAYLFAKGEQYYVESPSGLWRYSNPTLGAGADIIVAFGNKRGTVLWDSPVMCPAVHRRPNYSSYGKDLWTHPDQTPYMALTPMEIFTMRSGTRRAKGEVIIAGLGLGYQLIDVSNRKKVTKLTLIEISQELVDWLYPRIKPYLGCEVEVIVGDAYEVLPDMAADVVLLDTFATYGGNTDKRDDLYRQNPNLKYIWAWGTQYAEERNGYWR